MCVAEIFYGQEWMDVHPSVGPNIPYGSRTPTFNGAINRDTFDAMTDHVIATYFSQPNYLRVQKMAAGPKCAFFSIYELPTFIAGQGGVTQVSEVDRCVPFGNGLSFEMGWIANTAPGVQGAPTPHTPHHCVQNRASLGGVG
jgi:hypothetical protein